MSMVKVMPLSYVERSGWSTVVVVWDSKAPAQPQMSLITTVGLKADFLHFSANTLTPTMNQASRLID